ncbi:hypothetical protein [Streptomyces poriticola]|uniref:hypothetical protein n=1 Tax=Streptomyces poriticola TaxID=3120506 RepID=UPI002FCE22E5
MAKVRSSRRRRLLVAAGIAGAVAVGAWYYHVSSWPAKAHSDEVSAASALAAVDVDRRLDEVLGALPGRPQLLGDAALDRCLRIGEFEGAPPGPMHCQWQKARYVSFEGDPGEAAQSWHSALEGGQWAGSRAPLPPGSAYSAERYRYIDDAARYYLIVTMVRDSGSLPLLDNELYLEQPQKHRREHREFGSWEAAEQALADGRGVAEVSLVRAYYAEGELPRPPY